MSADSFSRRILIGLLTPPTGWPPPGEPPAISGYSLLRRVFAGLVGASLRPNPTDAERGAGTPSKAGPSRAASREWLGESEPSTSDGDAAGLHGERSERARVWPRLREWIVTWWRRHRAADEVLLLRAGLQQDALHQEALLDAGRRRFELLSRAIDDPSLADVVRPQSDVSEMRRRQFLFVQATYESMILEYKTHTLSWDELIARLRIFARNAVVVEYWERTNEERRAFPSHSLEARVGAVVDVIMDELMDDPEDWWIVGADL
ncbi:DUF6082 family protein [Streptomyces sp. MBT62]|uniref:DUF6082 family protein n=1 Tax=Streptomyces sp. MBT62 TaxID=2800410 RepID=UPI0019098911|nr:DUF6082 family protein [Streptomyces sp. MBT62]MBK3570973.1 hypothetical protein [Streptomyces sp. MBT62]